MTPGSSLRILFLSIEYPPETPNGIGSYVVEAAAALAGRGHEVHVLSCLPGQSSRDYRDGRVWVHRRGEAALRGGRLLGGPRTAERIRHATACWREVRRLALEFDVIETPDWMAEGLAFGLVGRPVVAQLHTPLAVTARYGTRGLVRDARSASFLEKVTVDRARMVISPSNLLVDALRRGGWLRRANVRIVRFPLDVSRWQSNVTADQTDRVVLTVGRLEPLKAPETLVEASALLARRLDGVTALLVGRSAARKGSIAYDDWLRNRIGDLDAPCRLLGEVPRPQLAQLCASCRVFVLPSLYENFPYAALEAMAAGRPVVCTSNNGVAEILDGSAAGVVVPPGDASALADAIEPFLADGELAARCGAAARDLVAEHCAPDRIAEQRERCYLAVVRGMVR